MDGCDELMPEWLKMDTGVVDSEDMPLSSSRATLTSMGASKLFTIPLDYLCLLSNARFEELNLDYFRNPMGPCDLRRPERLRVPLQALALEVQPPVRLHELGGLCGGL